MLPCIHNVFQDKGMYVKMDPKSFYNVNIMETIYVYPGNGRCIFKWETFLHCIYFLLLKLHFIIVNNRNPCPVSFPFPYMNKGTRRETNFFLPLLNQFKHYGLP